MDESAIASLDRGYYKQPTAVVISKNEKKNRWFEMSIFYKRFEMLITGGVLCTNNITVPFLGPTVPFNDKLSIIGLTSKNICIRSDSPSFVLRERNLRDWIKQASSYNWQVFSSDFTDKGFCNLDPLRLNRKTTTKIASFILLCVVKERFTNVEYENVKTMLRSIFRAQKDFQTIRYVETKT